MKKLLLMPMLFIFLTIAPSLAFAQGMMGNRTSSPSSITSNDHTVQEEAEGKKVLEKLQAKQLECKNLTNENFGTLGEYFMGQMTGDSHEAMNNMMIRMIGEQGEEQMHVVMGKRLSGCNTSAQLPQNGVGFTPMMNMMTGSLFSPWSFGGMMGGGNFMMGTNFGNTMGGLNGFGILGWLPMLFFWLLLILGIVALVRYLGNTMSADSRKKLPLDILKERYAKGEIDKKEFEEKKKDLV